MAANALETLFALNALAHPERRPFLSAWAADVQERLTAGERDWLAELRKLPELIQVGDVLIRQRCFHDVREMTAIIAGLNPDELAAIMLDDVVTEESIASGGFDAPFAGELALLWRIARALLGRREQVRGRPEPLGRIDYSFVLYGEGERAHVSIKPRRRGAPLDLIVAELMILANSTWGRWLAERKVPGVYRSQSLGRVRMSTTPAPHGAWSWSFSRPAARRRSSGPCSGRSARPGSTARPRRTSPHHSAPT
jgi:hypothetical protein